MSLGTWILFGCILCIFPSFTVTTSQEVEVLADVRRMANLQSDQFDVFEGCRALPLCQLFTDEKVKKNCLLFCCALCRTTLDPDGKARCKAKHALLQDPTNALNVHRVDDVDKLHLDWDSDKGLAMCYIGDTFDANSKDATSVDNECVDSDNFKLDLENVKYHCDEEVKTKMGCACYCNEVLPGSIYTNGRCIWKKNEFCFTSLECHNACKLSGVEDL